MHGDQILARSISAARIPSKGGQVWQYHSRSDSHSRVACWGIAFDLLATCGLLRRQVSEGKIAFGINHEMRDFRVNRKKNLDLVLGTPASAASARRRLTFVDLRANAGVVLSPEEDVVLGKLPTLLEAPVARVLVALEAKACMTEHMKARPRLYDELSSSFQTIHGDTGDAIAAGYAIVNAADTFISPLRNARKERGREALEVTRHTQPRVAERVVDKLGASPP